MKYSNGRTIFISCVVVLLIIALVASGTYAYFTLVVNVNNNGNIGGNTYKFDVSMDVNVIKQSTSLVPFSDALIVDAISKTDKCVDKDGYEICNIYKLNLTNNGNSDEILYQMQQKQLSMLHELDRVCKKNGLKYALSSGTCLGAVRHGGFIPWDDDIDVYMSWSDAEELNILFRAIKRILSSRHHITDYVIHQLLAFCRKPKI